MAKAKLKKTATASDKLYPRPIKLPCPDGKTVTLTAVIPNVVDADFTPGQLGNYTPNLNSTQINKGYAHTFEWKPEHRCCQIVSAKLTVKMKSLSRGRSLTSSDAGNDTITIMTEGFALPGHSAKIYSNHSFSTGNPASKTWSLTGSKLNTLNSLHRLSFFVQDDTAVLSATLQLKICCLKKEMPC